jgi:hypothetical protein
MTRLSWAIAGIILMVALANAVHQPFDLRHRFEWLFFNMDSTSNADRLYTPTRDRLQKLGLTRLSYRVEPGANWPDKLAQYCLVQYALAPVVLRPQTNEDYWVLMDYTATTKPFPAPDLIEVEDFGNGLALYKKRPGSADAGLPQNSKQ